MAMDPLKQFTVKPVVELSVLGQDVSLTNSTVFMITAVSLCIMFMLLTMGRGKLVPSRFQSLGEMNYEFVAGMLKDTVGAEGKHYFPFVFCLFMFILFGNLLGMLPYSFTFTSQIIVTFSLALMVFFVVTLIGFYKHGLHFLGFFAPKGVPMILAPILIPIEVISFLVRPVSLSIRLFANMLAGHMVMKLFASFIVMLGAVGGIGGILAGSIPFVFSVGLVGFEIFVSCLQAYIFAILTCVYISDSVHLH